MRFDVVTLFPELFAPFLETGVTRRAYESKQVDVRLRNLVSGVLFALLVLAVGVLTTAFRLWRRVVTER